MRTEGVEYTCNRCGRKEFLPWNPAANNRYMDEELHKTWHAIDKNIHLCPHCAKAYINLLENFLEGGEKIEEDS